GYVFKSVNKGATWTLTSFARVFTDPYDSYRFYGPRMAIDPNNANIVYVGTPKNGLMVTSDGGATWQSVSAVPVSGADGNGAYPGVSGIVFDRTLGVCGGRTKAIIVSSYGYGFYRSTDGGATWSSIGGSTSAIDSACVSSTGVYYAVGANTLLSYKN